MKNKSINVIISVEYHQFGGYKLCDEKRRQSIHFEDENTSDNNIVVMVVSQRKQIQEVKQFAKRPLSIKQNDIINSNKKFS